MLSFEVSNAKFRLLTTRPHEAMRSTAHALPFVARPSITFQWVLVFQEV